MKTIYRILTASAIGLSSVIASCSLDDRIDDLSGGYNGALIDKTTGKRVETEYYGAKLKLLDLEYGDVAVALDYNILPDGSYRNTKVYPSRYKVWALGPFFEVDTIYGDIRSPKEMNLYVKPNMTLEITDVKLEFGITATVTFSYTVNDRSSLSNEVGIVYGTEHYLGQRTAMIESEKNATTYKRVFKEITEPQGTFTETFYLSPGTKYYFRAMGRTAKAGDYWNYSETVELTSGQVSLDELPVNASVGVRSATSAVLQWSFPPIVDKIRVSYTDRDGEAVNDYFLPDQIAYVANLPHESTTPIKVQLLNKDNAGPEHTVEITTKALDEKYVEEEGVRPENVPFYNDVACKKSISGEWALVYGPTIGEDWSQTDLRFEYIDWWNTWLIGFANRMPRCSDVENFKVLHLQGDIHSLLDLLPFVNLEELHVDQGTAFSQGLTIDKTVDLTVLGKLKKLHTVYLGQGIPLDDSDFTAAGLNLKIVRK